MLSALIACSILQLPLPVAKLNDYVFSIEVNGSEIAQTGFKIQGIPGIFTAMHGTIGAKSIHVYQAGLNMGGDKVRVSKVDFDRDIVLLRSPKIDEMPDRGFVVAKDNPKAFTKEGWMAGYPSGITRAPRWVNVAFGEIKLLGKILNSQTAKEYNSQTFPNVEFPFLEINASVTHGQSGSPVLNAQGQLVGMIDGAFFNSSFLSWASLWSGVKLKSSESEYRFRRISRLPKSSTLMSFSSGSAKSDKKGYESSPSQAKINEIMLEMSPIDARRATIIKSFLPKEMERPLEETVPIGLVEQGYYYLRHHSFEKARARFSKYINISRNEKETQDAAEMAAAFQGRGIANFYDRLYVPARVDFQDALNKNAGNINLISLIGLCYLELEQFPVACSMFDLANRNAEVAHKRESYEAACARANLATADMYAENLEKARIGFESSAVFLRKGSHPIDLSNVLSSLLIVYTKMNVTEESIAVSEELEALSKKIYVGDDIRSAAVINNIGLSLHQRGLYKKAIAYFDRAFGIYERNDLSRQNPLVVDIISNRGLSLMKDKEFEEAKKDIKEAADAWDAHYGENNNRSVVGSSNYATIFIERATYENRKLTPDEFEEAKTYLEKCQRGSKALYGSDSLKFIISRFTEAQLLDVSDKPPREVEALYKATFNDFGKLKAFELQCQTANELGRHFVMSKNYLEAVNWFKISAELPGQLGTRAFSYVNWGIVDLVEKRYEEALDHLRTGLSLRIKAFGDDSTDSRFARFQILVFYATVKSPGDVIRVAEELEKGPDDEIKVKALFNKGLSLYKINKLDEGSSTMVRAFNLALSFERTDRDILLSALNAWESVALQVKHSIGLDAIKSVKNLLAKGSK